MVETELIERKDLREQMASRVEILDKVKELFLVPKLEVMTTKQVAEYFGVEQHTITMLYQRNKTEIDQDGVSLKSYKEFLISQDVRLETSKGKVIIYLSDNMVLEVPNRGIKCFSKRAILRIGMLLRDSEVAKEVRTQLLNTFEHSTTEQRVEDIDEELRLQADVGRAFMGGDPTDIMYSCTKVVEFKNRHIAQLTASNNELSANNKALAGEILEWKDRACINKAVRTIAGIRGVPFGYIWKELYDELLYKHKIGLSQRGDSPYIQHIKENEWKFVIQSLSAICEAHGVSVSKVMEAAKLE